MPKSATPQLKELARRLLVFECALSKTPELGGCGAFRVCGKLRGPLGKLMGTGGFRALLSRALVLAGGEVPWLLALRLKADGTLEGLDELEPRLDASSVAEGDVILVAQLLGLLLTFLGPALTLRLLQDIWAELDDLNL